MELMGESKVKESLVRVLKQLSHYQKNLGKVVVKYCDPISVDDYLK